MMKISPRILAVLCLLAFAGAAQAYTPVAEMVTDNVYAIVGPLDQRSPENDALNNNLGFIVTDKGVILIDSGASRLGAQKVEAAIGAVTEQPVKWVINVGSQDHRWLGNAYFADKGAQIIALTRTAQTQERFADRHMQTLGRFLGERLAGTEPLPATTRLEGDAVELTLGGIPLVLSYTDAHFPGDAMLWLPKQKTVFTGDLVYVDRMLSVHDWSDMQKAQAAFEAMEALAPEHVIPGHGHVTDLATARRDTGDYYDFLVNVVGAAAMEMESMADVIARHAGHPDFRHLEHFDSLHRANMNRTYLQFEAM
ncbi:MAG: MBL fold metallo-hydrolase [Gammaproteobacteria bacterium]|nr:MBL fold metallo-hydrolase [Gammaproteobacteria bacterium]MDX5503669.1 MBL fold metallo-hydrolase [Halomonas sp.]